MNKQIEIISHKVDWAKVIKMAFDKKDWGKEFVLYINGKTIIKCSMKSFNFEYNYASFKIVCDYPIDDYFDQWGNSSYIEYWLGNMTIEEFKRQLLKSIRSLLARIIKTRNESRASSKYYEFLVSSEDIDDDMIEKHGLTTDYELISEITNDEITESAKSELVDNIINIENEKYDKLVEEYVEKHSNDDNDFRQIGIKISEELAK